MGGSTGVQIKPIFGDFETRLKFFKFGLWQGSIYSRTSTSKNHIFPKIIYEKTQIREK